ncbi:MAG TPA: CbtA family protein [Steroidobacteraceae bacterium]|nr:CbtA family protein [Steroidobacteraceae bacterium]
MGQLVLRGFIVGIVAGLLAFGWARTFGEPAVDTAISFESAQDEAKAAAAVAAGKPAPPEDAVIFSRTVQSGIGLLTGMVGAGAGLGCLFAVLFAFAYGRLGRLAPAPTSVILALFGWLTVYVVPALKYPANPPSVGEPDTIKYRTGLYFLMMAISIASTLGALRLWRGLTPRYGAWNASLLALGAYLVVIAACFALLPGINEVPASFPAVTLWNFRIASLGIQAVLWGSMGLMFGYFGARSLRA